MLNHEHASEGVYSAVLQGLRNPRGDRICRPPQIADFYKAGANIDELVRLFQYEDNQGNEKFFADATVLFMQEGEYSTRDLLDLAELTDHEGQPILNSSVQIYDFMDAHGKVEDAKALARVRDSEGLAIYRANDKGVGGSIGFDGIADAIKIGKTAQAIQELVDIRNDTGVSVFRTPRDIHRFLGSKGELRYANALLALRDHKGKQIFNEFSIGLFKEAKGTIKYAQEIADLRDSEGQTIFSNGDDIVDFFRKYVRGRDAHRTIDTALEMISYSDQQGKTIFRDGRDIVDALRATDDNIDKIQPYLSITDAQGNTCFNGEEIAILLQHKVPVEYATKLAQQGLNGATIMYYYRAGFGENQTNFANSGEPKALILYPTDDPEYITTQAFRDDETFAMLKNIAMAYDVKIRAISSVDEMFEEIDQAQDTYYLVLGGHGLPTSIQFGKKNSKYYAPVGGNSVSLTPENTQLKEHLDQLPLLEYILLDSCLTGEGGADMENMVNFIADCAPGRLVTGPTEVTNSRLIEMRQLYPPEVHLKAIHSHKDCTYSHRAKI